MSGENNNMGHSQAKHFLGTFVKALSTHDYESVEQLRRALAIQHYRRAINRGESISENEVIPKSGEVEKWLTLLSKDLGLLQEDLDRLLFSSEQSTQA